MQRRQIDSACSELSELATQNRLIIYTSLLSRQKKKQFLNQIIIGNEKWIYYENPKHKKS